MKFLSLSSILSKFKFRDKPTLLRVEDPMGIKSIRLADDDKKHLDEVARKYSTARK